MEILYLYIRDHYALAQQNINFGGPLRFNYDSESKTLTATENPQFIDGFFHPGNADDLDAYIAGVSAIVGQNGTGKTSLLEFIKEHFVKGVNGVRVSVLLAVRREEAITFYQVDDIPISKHNLKELKIELVTLPVKETKHKYRDDEVAYREPVDLRCFDNVDFVYFSNAFDNRTEIEVSGLKELSTNYLLHNELRNEKEMNIKYYDDERTFETFHFNEIERQIDFVQYFQNRNVIPFALPGDLRVSMKRQFYSDEGSFNKKERQGIERNNFKELIERIQNSIKETSYETNFVRDRVINYFHGHALINLLLELVFVIDGFKPGRFFVTMLKEPLTDLSLDAINQILTTELNRLHDEENLPEEVRRIPENITALKADMVNLIDFSEANKSTMRQSEGTAFLIKADHDQFKDFYDHYKRTFWFRPYLNFNWRSMSSGELAFFNIYARFFSISDNRVRIADARLKKDIIVLVDEGDLYLHPEWQRQFTLLITTFLSKVYAAENTGKNTRRRNIQVIFTSNSPIPISDIPNGNIVFMQRIGAQVRIKDSLEDKKLTFGANIHTLLADSFFLNNGLLGDFARNKINHIIEILQGKKDQIFEQRDYLEKAISLIGEPVVKAKLVQMMSQRMQMNMMDVDARISRLEKEIDQLKNKG